ncbi:MAG: porin [Candidatus Aminicenantales bacterium]
MKNKHAVIAVAVLLALAVPARSQVKYGGYLALEYIKGQAESPYPHGNIENLLAGFLAAGRVGQKFGFTIEVRALGVNEFDLDQAWAGLMPSQAFTVRVGLYLVPFGTWNTASRPHETLLIRTPLNLEFLYPASWRDLGVLVEGQVGVLSYAAYLGNGLAEGDTDPVVQQFRDNNTDKAKGGRIGLTMGQGVKAGVSYYTGKYDAQNMRDLTLEGVDLSWVTEQWEIHGEITKAFLENPQPYARGKSEGYSIWACMGFKSFQPVGSFQKLKFTDPFHNGGIALDQSRWTAGLRYVLSSTLFLKAEYDWNREKGTALKNNQWQVQVGLSF